MTDPAPGPIVVGVDGSDASRRALRWAAAMARATRSPLQAVMAWEVPSVLGLAYESPDFDLESDTAKRLDTVLDEVFGAERPPELTTRVREGSAAHVLTEASRDAAMVVVGSRGHGGFYGLLLGSVSAALAEHAVCPVLVIHGDHEPLKFCS